MIKQKLLWDEKYSVKVQVIDDQHKQMFDTINMLIDILSGVPQKEALDVVINNLIAYKKFHFATEEKYFNEFHFEGAREHIMKHAEFSRALETITIESKGNSTILAFKLIDFLEDWLIGHLMDEDQKYVKCFKEHGLN